MYAKSINIGSQNISNLHNSTRRILFCCRVVGFLPLVGLTSESSHKLRFTLWSLYTIYYAFSVFGQIFLLFSSWYHVIHKGISIFTITYTFFYTSCFILFLNIIQLSWNWSSIIGTIEELEVELPPFRKTYKITVNAIIAFAIVGGTVEEILYLCYKYNEVYSCGSDNVTLNYFKANNPWIFDYIQVNMWTGLICEVFHLQSAFISAYFDWIIIVISLYLTEYFIIHNEILKKAIRQKHFSCVQLRKEYLKITHITKLINNWFGLSLMISVATNLYGICIQLFYTLNHGHQTNVCNYKNSEESKSPNNVNYSVYFTYSFMYLLLVRVLLILHLAARLHSHAFFPVVILYDLPNSKFGVEVQRYMSQIKDFKISLNGLNFFQVSSSMILSVLGTIVTYELVLKQFNK